MISYFYTIDVILPTHPTPYNIPLEMQHLWYKHPININLFNNNAYSQCFQYDICYKRTCVPIYLSCKAIPTEPQCLMNEKYCHFPTAIRHPWHKIFLFQKSLKTLIYQKGLIKTIHDLLYSDEYPQSSSLLLMQRLNQ